MSPDEKMGIVLVSYGSLNSQAWKTYEKIRSYYVKSFPSADVRLAFTSDFIVGFPGETEADFRDTLTLFEEVGFAGAYSFMYSPRPGTPAAEIKGQVPEEEKSERLQRLQAVITRDQRRFLAGFAGRTLDVLLEKPGRLPGQLVGRSPYLHSVQVMAPANMIGSNERVTITEIGSNSLFGMLAENAQAPILATAGA